MLYKRAPGTYRRYRVYRRITPRAATFVRGAASVLVDAVLASDAVLPARVKGCETGSPEPCGRSPRGPQPGLVKSTLAFCKTLAIKPKTWVTRLCRAASILPHRC